MKRCRWPVGLCPPIPLPPPRWALGGCCVPSAVLFWGGEPSWPLNVGFGGPPGPLMPGVLARPVHFMFGPSLHWCVPRAGAAFDDGWHCFGVHAHSYHLKGLLPALPWCSTCTRAGAVSCAGAAAPLLGVFELFSPCPHSAGALPPPRLLFGTCLHCELRVRLMWGVVPVHGQGD